MGEALPVRGINHIALVCRDMEVTTRFYAETLGFPLVKTVELPGGGQHFFFQCGSSTIAFFWFPDAPAAQPGVASAAFDPVTANLVSAHGSMNHLAMDVAPEEIDRCVERLRERGIECTDVTNHDDSEATVSRELHDGVFVRSIYFNDPDGILLELAAWTKPLTAADVRHTPRSSTVPA